MDGWSKDSCRGVLLAGCITTEYLMKKTIFALATVAAMATACHVEDKYYGKKVVDPAEKLAPAYAEDWNAHADLLDGKLIEHFMDKDRGTFYSTDGDRAGSSWGCYWPQAHAMDVLVDAYLRIPEGDARREEYGNYMALWYRNKGNNYETGELSGSCGFGNAFTDDSEWIILSLIRMYEATGERDYLDAAATTYEETVISRWTKDENGGGIRWCMTEDNSKNACSNAPGVLCAMRLWANTDASPEREQYLADAIKVYNWLRSTLYDPETGAVADHMMDGVVSGGPLTYNQGTFLGAAYELYKATGKPIYMVEAARAMRYAMNSMATDGVLNNEGAGDNALFKGILIRYAMNVWRDAEVDKVDPSLRTEIRDFIVYNGLVCWTKGLDRSEDSKYFFGPDWTSPGSDWDGQLNPQVSATTLIEAMALLLGE